MLRRGAALAAALLGLTLALLPATATADPVYGVVPQDGAVPEAADLELMPAAGISSVRLLASWATAEPSPGQYNWSTLDAMVRETTNHGIQPYLFLYGTPQWAAEMDGRSCVGNDCSVYAPKSAATRAAFADFSAAIVKRYGPGGDFFKAPVSTRPVSDLPVETATGSSGTSFTTAALLDDPLCQIPTLCPDPPPPPPPPPDSPPPPPTEPPCGCTEAHPITVWQIWNEQNSPKYFAPKVNVGSYAKLLAASSAAIKGVDPTAEVVLGGMWGPASAKKVVLPLTPYLTKLYKIDGIEDSFDSIALHPYSSGVSGSIAQLKAARKVMKRAGDGKASMWISELGWAAGGPKNNPYVKGNKGQARLLAGALKAFQKKQRSFRIEGVFWYSWRDKPGGGSICEWCGHAGLRKKDGAAKPAWSAFAKAAKN